jgi:hypothetical protein
VLRRSYQFLRGSWSVRRAITDRRSGNDGEFAGHATFTESDGELAYEERGELSIGGHRGPARRSLVYRELGDGALDVRFKDGRAFYVLRLENALWGAEHPCGDDLYTVTGRITGPDGFDEFWHAAGPAKDYDLDTRYTRVTAGPPPSA